MVYGPTEMTAAFSKEYGNGFFGIFEVDEEGSDCASVSSPDGDNTSIVWFGMPEDVEGEYANRKAYVDSKRKRLGPMGKLVEFTCESRFDESYGGILNFHLLGKKGGFFFFTARRGDVLLFIQAYSTNGKGQVPDTERERIIDVASRCMNAPSTS